MGSEAVSRQHQPHNGAGGRVDHGQAAVGQLANAAGLAQQRVAEADEWLTACVAVSLDVGAL